MIGLPENRVDPGQQDPHFDGEKEGILNDSIGKEIGIRTEHNSTANPFHVKKLKENSATEKLNQRLK